MDTVVVGAGIAGLVTARRIAAKGRSVLVVEARGRVGGRVLNHRLRHGGVIEAGGAFVGPTQDHILRLADQLKVPTFKEYAKGKSVYVSELLGRVEYSGTVPPDPTILLDAAVLLRKIDKYAADDRRRRSLEAPAGQEVGLDDRRLTSSAARPCSTPTGSPT